MQYKRLVKCTAFNQVKKKMYILALNQGFLSQHLKSTPNQPCTLTKIFWLLVLATNCLLTNPLPLGEGKKKRKIICLEESKQGTYFTGEIYLHIKIQRSMLRNIQRFWQTLNSEWVWLDLSTFQSTIHSGSLCQLLGKEKFSTRDYILQHQQASSWCHNEVQETSQRPYGCKERTKCQSSTATIHLVYVDTISEAGKQLITRKVELASNHGLSTHLKREL